VFLLAFRGYRIMDNRSSEETSWDPAVLRMELGELKGLGFDMVMTDFSIGELNSLVPAAAGLTEDDAVPAPPDTPVTAVRASRAVGWSLGVFSCCLPFL
jgi:hypothetical protein